MAIVFPNSPSTGDSFTASNGVVYNFDGEKWRSTTSSNNTDALNLVSTAASATPVLTLTNTNAGAHGGKLIFQSTHSGSTYNAAQVSSDGASGSGTGNLFFHTSGSEKMRIDSSGSLLVGTSTTSSFPDRLISAGHHTRASSYIDIRSGTVGALLFADGTSGDAAYRGQVEYHHPTDSMRLRTAATERMRIDSSGNVGIGTTAPAAKFHVYGATVSYGIIESANGNYNPMIEYKNPDQRWQAGLFGDDSDAFLIRRNDGFGWSTRLRFDNTTTILATDTLINGLTVGRGAGNVSSNAATGLNALASNTSGSNNTANGRTALQANTTGNMNVASGYGALALNTTGSENTASGVGALGSNTTANNNTAVGRSALFSNTTGQGNTASGVNALLSNTTGNENTASGIQSLRSNTTGFENVATGYNSLRLNTTGHSNTACGSRALYSNSTADDNVAVGKEVLYTNTSRANTAVGRSAMYSNSSGQENVGLGTWCMTANTTGSNNTAVGYASLEDNTSGSNNVTIGHRSCGDNTTGYHNIATGYEALRSNTTGNFNTAVGFCALRSNTTGSANAAFGNNALYNNTTANNNVAFGNGVLHSNTTGTSNTSVGEHSMHTCTTGIQNVALGDAALYSLTTGDGNIGIGFRSSTGAFVPVFNPTTHDNRLVLGHTSITNAYVKVSWTVTSDERDKMNFAPVPHGLDFVNQLKPTAFQFKVDRDTETPNGDVRYGFKAQEVLALEGDDPVIIDIEDPDHLKYKGEHLVPVLVNAVQELTEMVKQLQTEIKTLKG